MKNLLTALLLMLPLSASALTVDEFIERTKTTFDMQGPCKPTQEAIQKGIPDDMFHCIAVKSTDYYFLLWTVPGDKKFEVQHISTNKMGTSDVEVLDPREFEESI